MIFNDFFSIVMKFFHLHVYEPCHSRLILYSSRAKLKPSTLYIHRKCKWIMISISICMKHLHLRVWALQIQDQYYAVQGPISSPQPLKFHRLRKRSPFLIILRSIFMEFTHLHVMSFCHSRLVVCNTRIELKPSAFRVSQEVQTNSSLYLFVNIHESLSSTIFVSLRNAIQPRLSHPTSMSWNMQHKYYNGQPLRKLGYRGSKDYFK